MRVITQRVCSNILERGTITNGQVLASDKWSSDFDLKSLSDDDGGK